MTNLSVFSTFLKQYKPILYRRKERIVFPGEEIDNVYYITQGYVMQSIISFNGREFTPYIFSPQTFFPLIWFENDKLSSKLNYEYESLTPIEVFKIPKAKLISFLAENPKAVLALNEELTNYSAYLLKKLETRITSDALHMVILGLLDLAKLFGKEQSRQVLIDYWFTHQDIAKISGLTREVVTIQMNELVKKKLICYKDHFITITNLEILNAQLQSED